MAKVRKRKLPITTSSGKKSGLSSSNPQSTRKLIRRFHTLLKEKTHIQSLKDSHIHLQRLSEIESEINDLGGLSAYQRMSTIGQGKDRGGGSQNMLITWF